jgi:hypothetical protein
VIPFLPKVYVVDLIQGQTLIRQQELLILEVIALHVLLVKRDHSIDLLVFKLCLVVKLLMLHQLLLLLGSVLQIRLLVPCQCELCSQAGHFFLQCIVLKNVSLRIPT